jgi:hypothetical protein
MISYLICKISWKLLDLVSWRHGQEITESNMGKQTICIVVHTLDRGIVQLNLNRWLLLLDKILLLPCWMYGMIDTWNPQDFSMPKR